jgi:hypothetical protein
MCRRLSAAMPSGWIPPHVWARSIAHQQLQGFHEPDTFMKLGRHMMPTGESAPALDDGFVWPNLRGARLVCCPLMFSALPATIDAWPCSDCAPSFRSLTPHVWIVAGT